MDVWINIEPSEEAQQAVQKKYKLQEEQLPAAPRKRSLGRTLLLTMGLVWIGIPVLILLILRIPLRITRQLRKWTAPRKFYRDHIQLYEDEYEWKEKPTLEFPERKPTKREKRRGEEREKQKEELKQKAAGFKQAYTGELSTIENAFNYAVFISVSDYYKGSLPALYILDQFREKLFDDDGKPKADLPASVSYEVLCRNISVLLNTLRMPVQSSRFEQLALKNGGMKPEEMKVHRGKALYAIFFRSGLLMEAWNGFEKDLINCWPNPYFNRRVLVATPVEKENE